MFKSSNFCHVASNNRNNVKAGLFVYRTTDDLTTVTTNGYFNGALIDLKQHDLIIHEKYDATDATKVERNLLCVTEKTLDTVKTEIIKSDWEKDVDTQLANLDPSDFVHVDGSSVMSAPLKFSAGSMRGAVAGGLNGVAFFKMDSQGNLTQIASLSDTQFVPSSDDTLDIGTTVRKIERIYVGKLNNGYDIGVPVTNSTDTLALKSQVDDAANSGEQLYTTGVWYAKMYSATTIPAEAEVEGRNYADFSQLDAENKPIIVVYTYTSGAWATTATITPPANHNGYMTITSKIWDIQEQAGQQGGLVLWSHNQGTFTPYPKIVSFESINVTGDSTVEMPLNPSTTQIVNKDYVDTAVSANAGSAILFERKWLDYLLNDPKWLRADNFQWQTGTDSPAYTHLAGEFSDWSAAASVANLGENYWESIFFTGTEFIAMAKDGYFSYSTDGTTWTEAVLDETITAKQWRDMAYGLGMYVAVGTNGYISTSTDGHTWTAGAKKYGMGSNAWQAVAFDGTQFVAIAQYGHISTSTNGTTWSTAVEDANLGYNNWADIIWDGTRFLAISNTGYISTSTDGTTWAAATAVANLGSRWWRKVEFNGSIYLAIGDQGWVSVSKDGTNWEPAIQNANLGYGNDWKSVAWDGTKFVAIGERGAISSAQTPQQSETIAGVTIQFYQAADGHKICLPDQETALTNLYNTTGVAWYYIVDTANTRFKLPRSKHNGYAATIPVIGNGVSTTFIKDVEGALTTGTLESGISVNGYPTNTLQAGGVTLTTTPYPVTITTDPALSGLIAQQVTDNDQYKYLYFYVG